MKLRISFLFASLFYLVSAPSQVLINYLDNNQDPLINQDLKICGGDSINQVHVIVVSPIEEQMEIVITFPDGVNFSTNTSDWTVINENGTTVSLAGITQDGSNAMRASLSPSSLDPGDSFIFQWIRNADCANLEDLDGAISLKDEVAVFVGGELIIDDIEPSSNPYGLLQGNLAVDNVQSLEVDIGGTYTQEFDITNSGTGCIGELSFTITDQSGVTTNSIVIGGVSLMDSPPGTYTVDANEFMEVGNNDGLFDPGEAVTVMREVSISSCDVGTVIFAEWGCNGDICQTTSEVEAPINVNPALPEIIYTGGNRVQRTQGCDNVIMEHTFENVGLANAYDVDYLAGFYWGDFRMYGHPGDHPTNVRLSRTFPIEGEEIDIVGGSQSVDLELSVNVNEVGMRADLSDLTSDPDGAGGLDDLDGDGQYDDLAPGETYTVSLTHLTNCTVDTDPDGLFNRNSGNYKVSSAYADQCGNRLDSIIVRAVGSMVDRPMDQGGYVTGPTDANSVADIEVCMTRQFGGDFFNCPSNTRFVYLDFTLPPGFDFADENPSAGQQWPYYDDDDNYVENDDGFITRSGQDVTFGHPYHPTTTGRNIETHCFGIRLEYDCDNNPPTQADFQFVWTFECNINDNPCGCIETWGIMDYSITMHCPEPCPDGGILMRRTDAQRTTMGFVSPTDATIKDEALVAREAKRFALQCDSVNVTAQGVVYLDEIDSTKWDNLQFRFEYDMTGGDPNLLLDDFVGSLTVRRADGSASIECDAFDFSVSESDNGTQHRYDIDLSDCLGTDSLMFFDTVLIDLMFYVEENTAVSDQLPELLENIQMHFYTLESGIERACGMPWGVPLRLLRADIRNTVTRNANAQAQGCSQDTMVNWLPYDAQGRDWFPAEIRPFYRLDAINIHLESNQQIITETAELRSHGARWQIDGEIVYPECTGSAALYGCYVTMLGEPFSFSGNKEDGYDYRWVNPIGTSDEWPLTDMYQQWGYRSGYSMWYEVENECCSRTGQVEITYEITDLMYSDECQFVDDKVRTFTTFPNLAQFEIADNSGNVPVSGDVINWEIQLRNRANVDAGYLWIQFVDTESDATITRVTNTDAGIDLPISLGASGHWVEVDDIVDKQEFWNLSVEATYEGCENGMVELIVGWDCADYPSDPGLTECEALRDTLSYNILPSNLSARVIAQPAQPMQMCTDGEFVFELVSTEGGDVQNILLDFDIPDGILLAEDAINIAYPGDNAAISACFPADEQYIIEWDLNCYDPLPASGILGNSANTSEERKAIVSVPFVITCDYVSGQSITAEIQGYWPCGNEIENFGTVLSTPTIIIEGADILPIVSTVEISSESSQIEYCGTVDIDAEITIVGVSDFSVGGITDSLNVYLPDGLEYDNSTLEVTTNYPDIELFHSATVNLSSGGQKVVFFYDVDNGAELTFEPYMGSMSFSAIIADDSGCMESDSIRVESKLNIPALPCGGGFCEDRFSFASHGFVMDFVKPDVIISNFTTEAPTTESVDMTVELQISNLDVQDDIYLDIYCSDADGIMDGPILLTDTAFMHELGVGPYSSGTLTYTPDGTDTICLQEFITVCIRDADSHCFCSNDPQCVTTSIARVLPAELLSFTAEKREATSLLTWTTGTEVNLDAFVIERSSDGVNWTEIGRLTGRGGTDSDYNEYSFVDSTPRSGLNVYRLRMLDNNGRFEFSDSRSLLFNEITGFAVLPSISTGKIFININEADADLVIYNGDGRIIRQIRTASSGEVIPVDLSDEPSGIYLVRLKDQVQKIVIAH